MVYFKKISFLCYNQQDWESAENEFFRLGYEWEICGKKHIYCEFNYPRVIQNFRTCDKFGDKYLIMIDYSYHVRSNTVYKLTNLVDFKKYIRNKKLKKLKLWNVSNVIKKLTKVKHTK